MALFIIKNNFFLNSLFYLGAISISRHTKRVLEVENVCTFANWEFVWQEGCFFTKKISKKRNRF